jgi:integrase
MILTGSVFTTCATVSLRSWFRTKTDPKTVQTLLRHSNVKTTPQLYAHSVSEDRMAAQGLALAAILQPPANTAVN